MRSIFSILILSCVTVTLGCAGFGGPSGTAQAQEAEPLPSVTPTPIADANIISIAAVGDIMLASPFPDDTRMPPNDGKGMLDAVTPILSAADIAFGNMEGPIVDSGISEKCKPPEPPKEGEEPKPIRCFAFRMPTRYGKYLKEAGFDVMSVANNHAGDFGTAGRNSTRKTLDALGIKHAGSDRLKFSTAYIEVKGKTVAFIGFAHNTVSPNVNDLVTARRLVQAADKKADIVVVSFHGGAEGSAYQHVPKETEIFFGEKRGNLPLFSRTVIDAGADLVIGHGPHVLRGVEMYKDRLIAYSLGNFATYGWFVLRGETALTAILDVQLAPDGKFVSGKIHAGRQEGRGIPVLDPTGESVKRIRSLSQTDFPTIAPQITDDGTITK